MYGGEPSAWSPKLRGADRRRYTINALTRMRYCDKRGRIDLSYSGAPGTQPKGLVPWFDVRDRRAARTHIVFGHWAALGLLRRARRHGARHGLRLGQSSDGRTRRPAGEGRAGQRRERRNG